MIMVLALNPAIDKIYYTEDFMPGGLYRVGNIVKSAGGKGVNVARVASSIGEEVLLVGFKAGEAGQWLERQAAVLERVAVRFIEVGGETRTNNNIIDRKRGTETEVLEAGPVITEAASSEMAVLIQNEIKKYGIQVLVCTGSLPEGMDKGFYAEIIRTANSFGVKTILNTSGDTLVKGIEAKPFLVKPNRRELAAWAGRGRKSANTGSNSGGNDNSIKIGSDSSRGGSDSNSGGSTADSSRSMGKTGADDAGEPDSILRAARDINACGVAYVAASLGADGALMVGGGSCLKAEPLDIKVVNTIGSGDSMVAGIAVALSRSINTEDTALEMLRLGMACAQANTQTEKIGRVDPDIVNRFYGEVRIDKCPVT